MSFAAQRIKLLAALIFGFIAISGQSLADDKFISIGTADELGVYYPAGGAICRLVKRGLQEHGLRCFVESTGGSIDNLNALAKNQQDLGFVQSDWAYDAYNGTGNFAGQEPNSKLRMLFALHVEAFIVMVRDESGIKRFQDLKGKRVNDGTAGSGGRALLEKLMKVEGWTKKSFREHEEFKTGDQAKALCSKKVDAIIYTVGHPNGAVQEASTLCPTRIIPVEGPEIDSMIAENPYYHKTTIPVGMYRGVEAAVPTFGVRALLLTSADEDENTIYYVVKAVFDNLDNFKTLHPVFSTLTRQNMITDDIGIPLHPGALRFYKEAGLIK